MTSVFEPLFVMVKEGEDFSWVGGGSARAPSGRKLLYNNLFHKLIGKSRDGGNTYWNCVRSGCKGKLILRAGVQDAIAVTARHSCRPRPQPASDLDCKLYDGDGQQQPPPPPPSVNPKNGGGNKRKKKTVEDYVSENNVDFVACTAIVDGRVTNILTCRFCHQQITARSDRVKEHLNSVKHGISKIEAINAASAKGSNLIEESERDSLNGRIVQTKFWIPPTMEKPTNTTQPQQPLQQQQFGRSQQKAAPVSASFPSQCIYKIRCADFDSTRMFMFRKQRSLGQFMDATIWCEDKTIKAHRAILYACSTHFQKAINTCPPNMPPFFMLTNFSFSVVSTLIDFMYEGEISIPLDKLQSIIDAGRDLGVTALCPEFWNYDDNIISASSANTQENTSVNINHFSGGRVVDQSSSKGITNGVAVRSSYSNTNIINSGRNLSHTSQNWKNETSSMDNSNSLLRGLLDTDSWKQSSQRLLSYRNNSSALFQQNDLFSSIPSPSTRQNERDDDAKKMRMSTISPQATATCKIPVTSTYTKADSENVVKDEDADNQGENDEGNLIIQEHPDPMQLVQAVYDEEKENWGGGKGFRTYSVRREAKDYGVGVRDGTRPHFVRVHAKPVATYDAGLGPKEGGGGSSSSSGKQERNSITRVLGATNPLPPLAEERKEVPIQEGMAPAPIQSRRKLFVPSILSPKSHRKC